MRNVLFLNLTKHDKTATNADGDLYVKRVDKYIPVSDPSDALEVWQVAYQTISEVTSHIEAAIKSDHEILVALPGTSLLAATLAVGLWTSSNSRISLVTATKTREGYCFNLKADKIISFPKIDELVQRLTKPSEQ